jgi:GT2 family glycosyltransferase
MLVPREVFCRVGGFDEAYPTAYNDVDFCLRVNELGLSVVVSADAELYHYESLSLGHHFSGLHAGREAEQVRRMRNRWRAMLREDPFHNPNLSQRLGCEWDPAYPPRVAKPGAPVR